MLIATSTFGQHFGVGFRFGDPSGITVKMYQEKYNYEMNFGRTHIYYGAGWYQNQFDPWYKAQNFKYKEVSYVQYDASFPLALQAHRLHQKKLKNIGEKSFYNLDWYYGYGIQIGFQRYVYEYRYKVLSTDPWKQVRTSVTDFNFGPEGVIGLEYKFPKQPLTASLDISLFVEALDNPFRFWWQSGLGIKYHFTRTPGEKP
jgi:hypothetical protein